MQVKFKNDEYDGVFEEYNPKLKEWATKTNYKNGKREGLHTRKLDDGRKIIRFYKNDKEHGFELTLDSQGKLLYFDSCEVEGMRKSNEDCANIYVPSYEAQMKAMQEAKVAAKKADDNKSVEKWVTKIVFKEYHDNGALAEEGANLAAAASWNSLGTPDGEVKGYSRDGILIYKANYKDRKLEGPQTQIAEDKIYNTVYAKGVLTEETVLDAKSKKQLSHKTFFPDGSIKAENKK